jgi:hypothetical protein
MAMTLITTNTSSGAATSSFTSSIDSTYKLYIFKFIDVNPATDSTNLTFNGSVDGGSNYNVTKTTTFFAATHGEDASSAALSYFSSADLAQSTDFARICSEIGNGSDESAAGTLWLFNPSNTTYVKHYYSTFQTYLASDKSYNDHTAGYFNNTDNIDAVQFKMGSGNMDAVIKMYGVG